MSYKEARAQRKQYLQAEKDKKIREREVADKAMKEVVVKIEATRLAEKEMNDLAEAEAKVAKQKMFLGAAASMVEEKKFEELLHGKSREAAARQHKKKKIEQKVWENTMAGENKQRLSNKRSFCALRQNVTKWI